MEQTPADEGQRKKKIRIEIPGAEWKQATFKILQVGERRGQQATPEGGRGEKGSKGRGQKPGIEQTIIPETKRK